MTKGAIFDLDGVIVDTAKYHYIAWKELADELGFEFSESDNERLKGVSRMESLEILLSIGNISASETQKEEWAEKKNRLYVDLLKNINRESMLDGAYNYIVKLRKEGTKIALGSASKNAPMILEKLGVSELFDAIVDGNCIEKAKPDPEVFLTAASLIGLKPDDCTVFEDSQAGIDAACAGGFHTIAVDKFGVLKKAEKYISVLSELL